MNLPKDKFKTDLNNDKHCAQNIIDLPANSANKYSPKAQRRRIVTMYIKSNGTADYICKLMATINMHPGVMAISHLQDSIQTTAAIKGVLAVERSPIKVHVLIVHFNLDQTKSSDITRRLQNFGYNALLFGC